MLREIGAFLSEKLVPRPLASHGSWQELPWPRAWGTRMDDLQVSARDGGLTALQSRLGVVFEAVAQAMVPAMERAGISTVGIDEGMVQLQNGAVELAAQARRAISSGTAFADAVHDYDSYPLLSKFYHSVLDVMCLSLPPEMVRFTREFVGGTPPEFGPDVRNYLSVAAVRFDGDFTGALARFALFVGVRLNLAMVYRDSAHGSALTGLADELDRKAEQAVAEFLSQPEVLQRPIEPMKAMVALACLRLLPEIDELVSIMNQLQVEARRPYEVRAALEEELRDLDCADALLLRKHVSDELPDLEVFGENQPRMTNKRLRAHHPLALGELTDDAMNMRLHRLKEKVANKGMSSLKRTAPTLPEVLLSETERGDE